MNIASPTKNYARAGFKMLVLSGRGCWIRWRRHAGGVLVPQIFWI